MVNKDCRNISLTRQCELLNISKGAFYYEPVGIDPYNLNLMDLLDRQYTQSPFYGSRRMTAWLKRQGYPVNRKRVQRLMRIMGLEAIYPKANLSKRRHDHKIYPYLLKGLKIQKPDHVWSTDITYIRVGRGFVYLTAIIDWFSRYVISWRLSNTLEPDFCVDALEEAIHNYGCPEIFNTDQGSQFTSDAFTGVLKDNEIQISMDGRGRFQDNIFIERLWWTLKYHYFYLRTFESGSQLRNGLKKWFQYYNQERFHQSLDDWTPDEIYFMKQEFKKVA